MSRRSGRYDINKPMYFYGNPAAQIWKKVMQPIHEGLEYKAFPWPYVGTDTKIFGDLTEELAEQEAEENGETEESPSPSPSPTPSPSESPSPSPDPTPETTPTIAPTPTDPPEAEAPVG
jgi:membrane peptidoglycan carboxypeptidase